MPRFSWWKRGLAALAACWLVAACASNGKKERGPDALRPAPTAQPPAQDAKVVYAPDKSAEAKEAPKGGAEPRAGEESRVSLKQGPSTLGETVRAIGESGGGNLALMNGVEDRKIDSLRFKRATPGEVAARLGQEGDLAVQRCADYDFLFPPGYEALVDVSLTERLHPAYRNVNTQMAFGSGLHLFTVFAWMSYALDTTIVADNSVADARCGELTLRDVPLESALEAVVKSARVVSFEMESTEEYVFFHIPQNAGPQPTLLNEDALDDRQRAYLDQRVRIIVPAPPAPGHVMEMPLQARRLGDVLDTLSTQLGMRIVAERGLEDLPVNPATFNRVRIRTALDLLIRQWLAPEFGYQVLRDRIVIRRR